MVWIKLSQFSAMKFLEGEPLKVFVNQEPYKYIIYVVFK